MKNSLKIYIDYNFPNWNSYINKERSNKYASSSLKKRETDIVRYFTIGKRYNGEYPVKMVFTKYFKDKRQDLDNVRLKSIIDGLVKCGVIKNDNLTCVQEIVLKPKFDSKKDGIEIEIMEVEQCANGS